MKLTVASSEFLTDRERRGCNPATLEYYAKLVRWMCAYLERQGVTDVETVTTMHLEAYVADLRTRPLERRAGNLSRVTVRKWTISLKVFWAWVAGRGYVKDDPARDVPIPKSPRRLPKALTPTQAVALLNTPMGTRDRAIIALMLDTGIRVGEVCALDLSDVDEEEGTILVRVGKGDKQRMVVFSEATRLALRAWLAERRSPEEAFFVSLRHSRNRPTGSRLARQAVYTAIKAVAESAGLGNQVSPHRLRHTCATLWLNNGGGLQDISKLLGHSSITTTMIYTDVATKILRDHHRQYSPMESLTLRLKTQETESR